MKWVEYFLDGRVVRRVVGIFVVFIVVAGFYLQYVGMGCFIM